MATPGPLPDLAIGPGCTPGIPVGLDALVVRLTAPNPSMMTGPGTNTYVVGTDDAVVVVDPGPEDRGHLDAILAVVADRATVAVCVTHHHRDHALGARATATALRAPVVANGHAALTADVTAREGHALDVDGVRVVAWHTPGHASDHLCFLVEPLGWLLTGDHLMEGSTVVIRPPDGDLVDYLDAVARVRDAAGLVRLAPGHGRLLSDPARCAQGVLDHRAQRASVVERALRTLETATAAEVRAVAYADVGPERDEVATASCWAHLLALVEEGRATSDAPRDDDAAAFTATPR